MGQIFSLPPTISLPRIQTPAAHAPSLELQIAATDIRFHAFSFDKTCYLLVIYYHYLQHRSVSYPGFNACYGRLFIYICTLIPWVPEPKNNERRKKNEAQEPSKHSLLLSFISQPIRSQGAGATFLSFIFLRLWFPG